MVLCSAVLSLCEKAQKWPEAGCRGVACQGDEIALQAGEGWGGMRWAGVGWVRWVGEVGG